MFHKGDAVKQKDGSSFSNDSYTVTVDRIEEDKVWLLETRTHIHASYIELAEERIETKVIEVLEITLSDLHDKYNKREAELHQIESDINSVKQTIEVMKSK